MPKYSRTKRYEDLRRRMQSEGDKDLSHSDLSEVNAHLAKDVQSPVNESGKSHDPIHQRRYSSPTVEQQTDTSPAAEFNSSILRGSERSEDFDNEYVREFLKEAKQYNVDHGNAYTTNTDLNLLRILKEGQPEKKAEAPRAAAPSPAPSKPYPDADRTPKSSSDDTYGNTSVSDFLDSLDSDDSDQAIQETQSMTREDIAAEVQNMIRNAQQPQASAPINNTATKEVPSADTGSTTQLLNVDTRNSIANAVNDSSDTTRRQLLQETTQMRAQLDDYQDNLTEVSDKMKRTNQVLNVVLIVLIVALSVVLIVVVYWVLQSRGILG